MGGGGGGEWSGRWGVGRGEVSGVGGGEQVWGGGGGGKWSGRWGAGVGGEVSGVGGGE